jgi:hypothetical protein
MENFVIAIEGTSIHALVNSIAWLWPVLEILHFIGLSLLLGSMLIIDLRLAGLFRKISIIATHKMLPIAFIGFGLNLFSGVLFFFGDPARYTANIGFLWKMILVVIAGLNALWFWWKIDPLMKTWAPDADTPALAKLIACISLATWFGVLLLGRLIPYVGTG